MPSVRDHHPRNHAQHNLNHPKYTNESPIKSAPVHKCAVSNYICTFRHPESDSYSKRTYYRDKLVYASMPAHMDSPSHRATMRVAAPKSTESSSSLSTLLSEATPPRPTTHRPNPHKARHQRPKRLPLGRRKSTGTVIQVSTWKPESPPSSLPVSIPRVSVLPPAPEASQTHTTPSNPPQINIIPATPEVRRSLPLLGAVPTVTVAPPTPEKHLPCPPKAQHLKAPLSRLSQNPMKQPQHQPPAASAVYPQTKPQQMLRINDSIILHRSTHNLLGTYKGPPYQPFARPNYPAGYKPRLQRHAPFVNLRDCWRCPEAELTARLSRRRREGSQPGRHTRKRSPPAAQAATQDASEADENTPLLAAAQRTLGETLEDSMAITDPEPEPEPEAKTIHPSCMGTLFSTVFFPLIVVYAYFASAISTHLRDRAALAGPLGSYDTETARWLARADTAFPAQHRSHGSFSSAAGSLGVSQHRRTGSRGSASTGAASHSRKSSRGSITPEDMRGVFGVVRWGSGIGEEYDPC